VLQQLRIDDLVTRLVQQNGTDLHLKVGAPPAVRVRGLLDYLEGFEVLRQVDTEELLKEIIPEKLVEEFEEEGRRTSPTPFRGWGVCGSTPSGSGVRSRWS